MNDTILLIIMFFGWFAGLKLIGMIVGIWERIVKWKGGCHD